jgi:hypothetical protein
MDADPPVPPLIWRALNLWIGRFAVAESEYPQGLSQGV